MKNWPQQFPRLNDLYERSERSNPDNYFNQLARPSLALVIGGELWEQFFGWVEQRFARLDPDAWEQLAAKALPEVCRKDARRGWSQLWNYLNEALGYVLLADRGYAKIRFVDCG